MKYIISFLFDRSNGYLLKDMPSEQLADAIRFAIEMPLEERQNRMRHMRRMVRNHNVYRWAADLISDLAEMRLEARDMTTMH